VTRRLRIPRQLQTAVAPKVNDLPFRTGCHDFSVYSSKAFATA
jgi:hypothetical protein